MKKHVPNKNLINRKRYKNLFSGLLICGTLLLNSGCDKTDKTGVSHLYTPQLNAQEHSLVGKWYLKKSEAYEVFGVDSTGQYICNLIGSSASASVCKIEFKAEYKFPPFGPDFTGAGDIGGCDSTKTFIWKLKQANKLETGFGNFYDIIYLTKDSTAFSKIYIKDILTLKSVFYYKRN
ncbi:MAG TPA: hypothetical protein VNZ49_16710 [Bacteroidia bacterium]|jgi:hypothetical protein|nr:hypothetical protein [Bacteroidia bacterium]